MKETLTLYYAAERSNFEGYLNQLHNADNMEVIHQLRLSIKKIKALYSFIWYLTPERKTGKKNIRELDFIYKPAGEIRDTQVHLELIENYKNRFSLEFDQYTGFFRSREEGKFRELMNNLEVFDQTPLEKLGKKLDKVLAKYSDEEIYTKAGEIFEDKLNMIRRLHKIPTDKDKNLHRIRRYLKEARYLLSIFNDKTIESQLFKVSLGRLKQIEQTVGKWHDQVNALMFLKFYEDAHKNLDKAEKAKLDILNKSVKRYKELLLQRINLAFKHELDIH